MSSSTPTWIKTATKSAYPLVIRINPGCAGRSPLACELELMEGCLWVIPEFLADKDVALTTTLPVASGKLDVRLSWVDEG